MHYRFLLILSLLYMSSGCKSTATTSPQDRATGLQYLALGNSYTIGQSVAASDTYPQQLVNALNGAGVHWGKPRIIAQTGWTTADLQRAMDQANLNDAQFDLVTLLIGVNNEFQGKILAVYETEFTDLLQRAIRLAHNDPKKVFVLSIPDYGFTPFGEEQRSYVSPRIDQFNEVVARITRSLQVVWVDITPISRAGLDQPELVARDGLHPSAKMYALWVDQLLPEVRKMVR
jgi:acyl-CoA thioesterase-1